MQQGNVYWDWSAMERDGVMPSILAIGDSWFWYPFPGGSLISRIGPLVAPRSHTILALGNNGAKAHDYAAGKYHLAVETALRLQGSSLSAVFISGGGNDFAGFNDLRPMLRRDCSQAPDAASCFADPAQVGSLDALMQDMADSYHTLIDAIRTATSAGCQIVLHNYDVPIPTGAGLFGHRHAWLKPALDDAGVPAGLQQSCLALVLTRFTAVLQQLANRDPAHVTLIDSRGTLSPSDWANELHPTPDGFDRIAVQRWLPALRGIGLA